MKTITLKKGRAIGAHHGFADTFNWLVRCFKNLKGGQGCKVNWVADDTPMIDVNMYDCGNVYNEGGGDITLRGTDDSSATANDYTFSSAADSNVVVTVGEDEDTGAKKVVIGVYYV